MRALSTTVIVCVAWRPLRLAVMIDAPGPTAVTCASALSENAGIVTVESIVAIDVCELARFTTTGSGTAMLTPWPMMPCAPTSSVTVLGVDTRSMSTTAASIACTSLSDVAVMTDARIASILHKVNKSEIEAGKLAEMQGQSPEVRDYGRMLTKDHTDADTRTRRARGPACPSPHPTPRSPRAATGHHPYRAPSHNLHRQRTKPDKACASTTLP